MNHHAGILQQRVEIAAVGGGRDQPLERVRREQQEQQESGAQKAHDADHPRHHRVRQAAAENRDGDGPQRQHQHPQQHRPFVSAPDGGEAIVHRQRGVGIGRHVQHRKVIVDEGVGEAREGDRDEHELALRRGPGERDPVDVAARRADERQDALQHRDQQGDDEGKMADLGDHQFCAPDLRCIDFAACWLASRAFFSASAACGGM